MHKKKHVIVKKKTQKKMNLERDKNKFKSNSRHLLTNCFNVFFFIHLKQ